MTAAVTLPADLIDNLKAALGPKGWSQDPQELEPHVHDWRGRFALGGRDEGGDRKSSSAAAAAAPCRLRRGRIWNEVFSSFASSRSARSIKARPRSLWNFFLAARPTRRE